MDPAPSQPDSIVCELRFDGNNPTIDGQVVFPTIDGQVVLPSKGEIQAFYKVVSSCHWASNSKVNIAVNCIDCKRLVPLESFLAGRLPVPQVKSRSPKMDPLIEARSRAIRTHWINCHISKSKSLQHDGRNSSGASAAGAASSASAASSRSAAASTSSTSVPLQSGCHSKADNSSSTTLVKSILSSLDSAVSMDSQGTVATLCAALEAAIDEPGCTTFFAGAGGIEVILSILQKYFESAITVRAICGVFGRLMYRSEENRNAGAGGIPTIIGAMSLHEDDPHVAELGSFVLKSFASGSPLHRKLVADSGGVKVLLSVIHQYALANNSVAFQACGALAALAEDDEFSLSIGQNGGVSSLMQVLHNQGSSTVFDVPALSQTCQVLQTLMCIPANRILAARGGCLQPLVSLSSKARNRGEEQVSFALTFLAGTIASMTVTELMSALKSGGHKELLRCCLQRCSSFLAPARAARPIQPAAVSAVEAPSADPAAASSSAPPQPH